MYVQEIIILLEIHPSHHFLFWIHIDQQAEFFIPVERFELSKPIKMVIYYGTLDLLYCKEFIINVSWNFESIQISLRLKVNKFLFFS